MPPAQQPSALPNNQPAEKDLHLELPDEPPALTPTAARALLRLLLHQHTSDNRGNTESESR